ncbi:MAG: LysM peptidoglycan-binding domain-containing protein [Anaerolineales bacterium]|jgi:LysM repeat protein
MKQKWFYLLLFFTITAASLGLSANQASAQTTYTTHVVERGETLGKIAYRYCTTWKAVYDINRDSIGDDPNLIQPGMVLTVPANCDKGGSTTPPASGVYDRGPITHATGIYRAPYYTVAWGDTLSSIGQRFGVPWQDIATANGIKDTLVYAGQTLLIPDGSSGTTAPPEQGPAERVYFQPGAVSATDSGIINQGIPKSYILWARSGQVLNIQTVSHGEPLGITIGNTRGDLLPVTGVNSQIKNSVAVTLPESGDFIVTVRPLTLPENPQLTFDITFTIP